MNDELINYIRKQIEKGVSKEEIRKTLSDRGWQAEDIEKAFSLLDPNSQQSQVQERKEVSLPRPTVILYQAFNIYKQRFVTFLVISIIPILIILPLIFIFGGIGFLSIGFFSIQSITRGIAFFIPLAIIFFTIIFFIQAWGQIALLYAVVNSQERIGIIESYRSSLHKLISFVWVLILGGAITLGGFFLFGIFGIIFIVWFSFAGFILVSEDLKGINALIKSREYVRGKWVDVFLRYLFIWIFSLVISLIPLSFFYLLKSSFGEQISAFLIRLLLTPLTAVYEYLLYKFLKSAKSEMIFTPTNKQKAIFYIIATLPVILFITIILLTLVFSGRSRNKIRYTEEFKDTNPISINLKKADSNTKNSFFLEKQIGFNLSSK